MSTKWQGIFSVVLVGVIFGVSPVASAQTAEKNATTENAPAPPNASERVAAEKETKEVKETEKALLDKYFGAGIYTNIDFGKERRVKSARVVSGVVRIEEESTAQVGFLLEAHKFIGGFGSQRPWVHGPFVGVIVNGTSGFDTAVLGYMWGASRVKTGPATEALNSLNLGIGLSVTPRAQVLGDGVKKDEPLPAGETEVRYKQKTLFGLTITVSFGF